MPGNSEPQSIWHGVFERFDDVPAPAPVFNDGLWVEKQRARALNALAGYKSGAVIPDGANARDYPLPAMVALLLARQDKVRIIDFGGAMGQSYFDLLSKIPDAINKIEHIVVEMPAVTENIPEALAEFSNLSFTDDYKKISGKADIVHIGSTLQYIDDWQGLLNDLIERFDPGLFVLSDLLVGDIPSFVTAQTYYGRTIRVRFINVIEFLDYWSSTAYDLIYRAYFCPLGNDDYFPNHALPETHRIKKACHLVFSKEKKS